MAEANMAMRSIRANPEAFERLGQIAKDGGLTQGAALEALIKTWDVAAAREQIGERAADIDDFAAHVQALQDAFLRSLQLARGAEDRARADYASALASKDRLIAELQARCDAHDADLAALRLELAQAESARDTYKRKCDDLERSARTDTLLEMLVERFGGEGTPEMPKRSKPRKRKSGKTGADADPQPLPQAHDTPDDGDADTAHDTLII